MSKKTIVIIVLVAVCLAGTAALAVASGRLGGGQPQEGAQPAQEQPAESQGQSQDSGERGGGGYVPPSPEEIEGSSDNSAPYEVEPNSTGGYSGAAADLFELLTSSAWANPTGDVLVFREDGTCGRGASTSEAGADEFRILNVKGGLDDEGGCQVVAYVGGVYDVFEVVRNQTSQASRFASSPTSPYLVHGSSFWGDGDFYRDTDQTVSVAEITQGPEQLTANQEAMAAAVAAWCAVEYPTVTEAVWAGSAHLYWYDPENPLLVATYRCNDAKGTALTVSCTLSTGVCQVVDSAEEAVEAQQQSDGNDGSPDRPQEGGER